MIAQVAYLRKRKLTVVIGCVLLWYIFLHLWFYISVHVLPITHPEHPPSSMTLGSVPTYYDGGYYVDIAEFGYHKPDSPRNIAFYPVYPMLLRGLHAGSFGLISYETAAFLLNAASLVAAAVFLYGCAKKLSFRYPWLPLLLVFSWPWAFFFGAMYAESLYIALVSACLYLLIDKKYFIAAVLAAIASATRLPGFTLSIVVFTQYLVDHHVLVGRHPFVVLNRWSVRKLLHAGFYVVVSCSGLIAWLTYQWASFGSPFAFRKAYETGWTFQVFNPFFINSVLMWVGEVIQDITQRRLSNAVFELASWLLIPLSVCVGLMKKVTIPASWYCLLLVSAVLFSLNSNLVSLNRYVLPLVPIAFIGARIMEMYQHRNKKVLFGCILSVLFVGQLLFAALYVNQFWVG